MKYSYIKTCISPKLGTRLAGFGGRAPSQGILDDLHLHLLLLEDDQGKQSLLINGEIIGFESSFVKKMRAFINKKYPKIEECAICFNATHTHGGPATVFFVDDIGAYDKSYMSFLEKKLKDAVSEVFSSKLKSGNVFSAMGTCNLSVNRRLPDATMGINEKGSTDKELGVLVIRSEKEEILLLNYACHPTIMHSNYISGDYPSAAARALKAQSIINREVIFLQGAGADLKSRCFTEDGKKFRYGSSLDVANIANILVDSVNKVLEKKMKAINLNLESYNSTITLPYNTNPKLKLPFLKGGKEIYQKRKSENKSRGVTVELQYWSLSKDCKLIALSCELCHKIGVNLKKNSNCKLPFFLGYSNGLPAYIPTDTILKEGGYEGYRSMQYYGHPHPIKLGAEKKIYQCLKSLLKKTAN